MKNKKSFLIAICFLLVLVFGGIYIFTRQDKETSFTIFEKQWLENNKSKVIDISILKDIPILSYDGSGILFDFLSDFESVTGLDFNPVAYQSNTQTVGDYSFGVFSEKRENDILIYSDNYVLITRDNIKYNVLSEIEKMNIGVLASDYDKVLNAMDGLDVSFVSYDSVDELVGALVPQDESVQSSLDAIVLPKLLSFGNVLSNDKMHISYNINEIKQDYVIRLGSDDKLNEIFTKYYNKWNGISYRDSFDKNFSDNYFSFSKIDDKSKANFKSKRYVYGYVDNSPYDLYRDDKYYGINKAFLSDFSDISEIDIQYKKYSNFDSLHDAFNSGEIDLFFDFYNKDDYISYVDLISNYDEQGVVLALPTNKVSVSSVKSLIGYDVATISNSKLSNFLESKGVSFNSYSTIDELVSKVNNETIIVLDSEVYNFYSSKLLEKYKSIYSFNLSDDYYFKVADNDINKTFIRFFNYYLSFVSNQEISNIGYSELLGVTAVKNYVGIMIVLVAVLVVILSVFLIYQSKKFTKDKVVIVKDSKIKYIDVLTSLKNRNYLNDNIDVWDESMVYPQGIVVVDLNNIAYINDNYGHSEGDKVIKEAANILIKTQISNTEIMRTNGNEFLIYMVGYDEKQIVSYIRRLNKDLRDLSHDFGAAIGYSIITDEIKTIDDAINEATMDMKNNKQDMK